MNIIHIGDFEFHSDDEDPRLRDTDLAKKLGYERPRDIRELIERMVGEEEIDAPHVRRAVRRTSMPRGGDRETEVNEYWLDETQAILVAARSKGPVARQVRQGLVKVFIAARDQARAGLQKERGLWGRLQAFILAEKPAEWERCFQPSLVVALCALHPDQPQYMGGRHPRYLASTYRKIYDTVFSSEIGRALKVRNPTPKHGSNHSQELSPEAREYFVAQLASVEVIARQSSDKDDLWGRLEREYQGGMLQMPMHLSPKRLA